MTSAGLRDRQFYGAVVSRVVQELLSREQQQQLSSWKQQQLSPLQQQQHSLRSLLHLPPHLLPPPQQQQQLCWTHGDAAAGKVTVDEQASQSEKNKQQLQQQQQRQQQVVLPTMLRAPLPAAAAVDLLEGLAIAHHNLLPEEEGGLLLSLLLSQNLEAISRNTGLSMRLLSALRHLEALHDPVVLYILERQLLSMSAAVSRELQSKAVCIISRHINSPSSLPQEAYTNTSSSSYKTEHLSIQSSSLTSEETLNSVSSERSTTTSLRYAEPVDNTLVLTRRTSAATPTAAAEEEGALDMRSTSAARGSVNRTNALIPLTLPRHIPGNMMPSSSGRSSREVITLGLPVEPLIFFLSRLFSWKGVTRRLASCYATRSSSSSSSSRRTDALEEALTRQNEGSSMHAAIPSVRYAPMKENNISEENDNFFSAFSHRTPNNAQTLKTLYMLAADYLSVLLLSLSMGYKEGFLRLSTHSASQTALSSVAAADAHSAAAIHSAAAAAGGKAKTATITSSTLSSSGSRYPCVTGDAADGDQATVAAAAAAKTLHESHAPIFVVHFPTAAAAEAIHVLASVPAAALSPLHMHAAAAVGDLLLQHCNSSNMPFLNSSSSTSFSSSFSISSFGSSSFISSLCSMMRSLGHLLFSVSQGKQEEQHKEKGVCMSSSSVTASAAVKSSCATGVSHEAEADAESSVKAARNTLQQQQQQLYIQRKPELSTRYMLRLAAAALAPDMYNICKRRGLTEKERQTDDTRLEEGHAKQFNENSTDHHMKPEAHITTNEDADNHEKERDICSRNDTNTYVESVNRKIYTNVREDDSLAEEFTSYIENGQRTFSYEKRESAITLPSVQSTSVSESSGEDYSACSSQLFHILCTFDLRSFLAKTSYRPWESHGEQQDAHVALQMVNNKFRCLNEETDILSELQDGVYTATRIQASSRKVHETTDGAHGQTVDAVLCRFAEEEQSKTEAKKMLLNIGYECMRYVERYLKEAHTTLLLSDAISMAFWCIVALSLSDSVSGAAVSRRTGGRNGFASQQRGSNNTGDSSGLHMLSNRAQANSFVSTATEGSALHASTAAGETRMSGGTACGNWIDADFCTNVRKVLAIALHSVATNTAAPADRKEKGGNRKARQEERVLLMIQGEDRNALMLVHSFLRLEAPDLYASLPAGVQNLLRVVAASRISL